MNKDQAIRIRVTEEEKKMIQEIADRYHLSISATILLLVTKEHEKMTKEKL